MEPVIKVDQEKVDADKEYEADIREQCRWDEIRARQLDREDRENQTGDYAPREEEE